MRMTGLRPLIQLLADGDVHSGEEIGRQLGISRTAVWKQLKLLEPLGLQMTAVKGQGYCLSSELSLLDRGVITSLISGESEPLLGFLQVLDETQSTNLDALGAKDGEATCGVFLAEHQTAGKGRRGRQWVSPYAASIYMSVSWKFDAGAAALEGLSLAVGLGVVKALEKFGLQGLGLKWPNDIYYRDKKLAGVLIELAGDLMGDCKVVAGVGLNVNLPPEVSRSIDRPWIDLKCICDEQGVDLPARSRVVAALIDELLPLLGTFSDRGFEYYRDAWLEYDICKKRIVSIESHNSVVSGLAQGVNASGELLVAFDEGVKAFTGGEVSLRW